MHSHYYWIHFKHGNPVYSGGTICFPGDPQPGTFSIKCRLFNGKFHVAESGCGEPYVKGYIVPAEDIAYFVHEDDELASQIDSRYLYDIFKNNIDSNHCLNPHCGYHSP